VLPVGSLAEKASEVHPRKELSQRDGHGDDPQRWWRMSICETRENASMELRFFT